MDTMIEKIPGGFRVDGLELFGAKCGCGTILSCCHSWSKVKKKGNSVVFTAKTTSPDTRDAFVWGYVVKKGEFTVEVSMEDARDKTIYSGFYPPPLEEWVGLGWKVVSKTGEREDFGLWRCAACKWLYKEGGGNVPFEELPDDWQCPVCMAGKESFEKIG